MSAGRDGPGGGLAYREIAFADGPVESAWTLAIAPDADPAAPYLVLPDGSLDVLHRLGLDRDGHATSSDLLVAGPDDRASRVAVRPGERFAGLRFRPGWGGAAVGVAAGDVLRRVVPAGDVAPGLSTLAAELADGSVGPIRRLLAHFAGPRCRMPAERALAAIALLRGSGGRMRVETAARRLGVSPRTFRREVASAAGLSPKALCRVFRFRRALAILSAARPPLAELAARTGYADQAHMTREFQELGGFSPAETPARPTA